MGLFGRSRKSGERKPGGSPRCMECGMAGGEHTDWCPAEPKEEPNVPSGRSLERYPEAEGLKESDP